jgi:hypothetical protein
LTPLKVDFNEYFTLFSLISQSITMIANYYPRLMELSGHVLLNHQYESNKGDLHTLFNPLIFKIFKFHYFLKIHQVPKN